MKKFCIVIFLTTMFSGCAPQLTTLQIRELQSRELQGTFENAYKANLQVLQDYGYVVKSSDYQSGVIQGETGAKAVWGLSCNTEVTATLEQFGPGTVKERISIVKKLSNTYGANVMSETVVDAQLYQRIYNDIQKEMFVRQNLNK